ncbi:DNA topoisomerase IB [Devosia nitrariae]|uniref:DNA topoisomerase n=1 Tax=Devosia nitrariae TaxID=2071872 RepID=A0ABQ5W6C5_9HYPH|nr:DNA topoisomerase IB [Devosia nitrariae]GLQ55349.1 DNA topoisomerase [Devosia nitrariae]
MPRFGSLQELLRDRSRSDELGTVITQLVHVSDQEPGIRRQRRGRAFTYVGPDGERLGDEAVLARIRGLAIPPAWTDVWISPEANGHIQATGRDQKGRKQYRYHSLWTTCRDEVKYGNMLPFAGTLPKLRRTVEADLGRRGLELPKVCASVVWLLDNTLIRVGNSAYARENRSFGLTTLRDRHVEVEGARLRFDFRGKSGKHWRLALTDRRIARIVRSVQDLPGQHLFQYLDEDGSRRPLTSQEVNGYIQEAAGDNFSSKDFRTWAGTVRALELFSRTELPESKTAQARTANAVIDEIASRLGNTRAVCRRCYIHPQVMLSWSGGTLAQELAETKPRGGRRELDASEAHARAWLALHEAVH